MTMPIEGIIFNIHSDVMESGQEGQLQNKPFGLLDGLLHLIHQLHDKDPLPSFTRETVDIWRGGLRLKSVKTK